MIDNIINEISGDNPDLRLAVDSYNKGFDNPLGLPPQRLRYANEYFRTADHKQAQAAAGYESATAGKKALEDSKVRLHIQMLYHACEDGNEGVADTQEVLEFLTSAMRGELYEPVTVGKGKGREEIQYLPPRVGDRLKAGELLGKRYSVFDKDLNVTVNAPTFKGADDIRE